MKETKVEEVKCEVAEELWRNRRRVKQQKVMWHDRLRVGTVFGGYCLLDCMTLYSSVVNKLTKFCSIKKLWIPSKMCIFLLILPKTNNHITTVLINNLGDCTITSVYLSTGETPAYSRIVFQRASLNFVHINYITCPFYRVPSTAAVTGCPGGCRLYTRQSCHARWQDKRNTVQGHSNR
jgi:hypothetical protein